MFAKINIKLSKAAWVFVIALVSFTALLNIVGESLSQFIMFVPAISALLATILTKRSWKAFGWKFSFKWIGIAWVIPIIYATIAYTAIWLLRLGEVPNPLFLEHGRITMGVETTNPISLIIMAFFYITILMLIPATVFAIGEELGWRGLLLPELLKSNSFNKAALLSSLIWALWHLPAILQGYYGAVSTPMLYRVAMFVPMVMLSGYIISWIWYRSKSIFAVGVFHATHNGVIQMFFDAITLDNAYTPYVKGEFGIALVLSNLLVVWYVVRRTRGERLTASLT